MAKQARAVNFVLLICVVIISLVVDGNGRIFGLSEKPSCIVAILLFSGGILLSATLATMDKAHRLTAVISLIAYLVLAAPAILPI